MLVLDLENASRLMDSIWSNHAGDMYDSHVDGIYATDDAVEFMERLCDESLHSGLGGQPVRI